MSLPTFDHGFSVAEVEQVMRAKRNGDAKNVHIIDIRERFERAQYGHIPYSINVPLGEFDRAFAQRDAAFKKAYGGPKPSKKEPIIIYSRNDMRLSAALEFLDVKGYKYVVPLRGGYDKWRKEATSPDLNDDL